MRTTLLAAFCGLLCTTAVWAQSFDEFLPDGTVFYVSVENWPRTVQRFEESPLSAFWADPAVQGFTEMPKELWSKWRKSAEESGVSIDELLSVIDGQVAFGVFGSEDPEVLLMAEIGKNREKLREQLARAEREVLEGGKTREEEEFRGFTIVTYRGEEENDDDQSWCIAGSQFLVSSDLDQLRELLVRREQPGEGAFGARPVYRRVRERLGGRADLFAYLDGGNLKRVLEQEDDETTMKIANALGLDSFAGAAMEVTLGADRLDMRLHLAVQGEKHGLLHLLSAPNSALKIPRFVPPDADGATVMTLDLQGFYQEVRRIAESIEEGSAQEIDGFFEGMKAQLGVDIPKDLIGSLGNEVTYYSRLPEEQPPEGAPPMAAMPKFVATISLSNQQKFDTALQTLLMMAPAVPQEYMGIKYWAIPTPIGIEPTLSILPGHFVLATDPDSIKELISRYGKDVKGLTDRAEYAAALEGVPAERFGLSVANQARTMRQGFMAGFVTGMRMAGGPAIMDLSRFPSVETLERYFGVSVGWMTGDEEGITIVSRMHLKRPEAPEDAGDEGG